jgi:hypothetical protein
MMSIDVDMLTVAQAQAIADQTMVYFAKETPCDGLDGLSILTPTEFDRRHGGTLKPGEIGVEFRYDAGAHIGLETTVFDAQGNVVWSQDWG